MAGREENTEMCIPGQKPVSLGKDFHTWVAKVELLQPLYRSPLLNSEYKQSNKPIGEISTRPFADR